jgi:hypothetical protein
MQSTLTIISILTKYQAKTLMIRHPKNMVENEFSRLETLNVIFCKILFRFHQNYQTMGSIWYQPIWRWRNKSVDQEVPIQIQDKQIMMTCLQTLWHGWKTAGLTTSSATILNIDHKTASCKIN